MGVLMVGILQEDLLLNVGDWNEEPSALAKIRHFNRTRVEFFVLTKNQKLGKEEKRDQPLSNYIKYTISVR